MTWTVEYLNETVEQEFEAVPADMRARFVRVIGLIERFGLTNIGEPHVKHIDGKLWEMRAKGRDGIARSLYVAARGRRVVLVRVFIKKTQKTPKCEIRLAQKRAQEIDHEETNS